jgi:L-arabinokinase
MDQITSACGKKDQLLQLLCQPNRLSGYSLLPDDLRVWGMDSGVQQAVRGEDSGTVRTAAFMGLALLEEYVPGQQWDGYLVNITDDEWDCWASDIPISMSGKDFLETGRAHRDEITCVDPNRIYAVRACTEHPIKEHRRVQEFVRLLASSAGINRNLQLGALMYDAHESYSACGLGSASTNTIVARVRQAQTEGKPLYGAKITGGGSGGTVAILTDNSAEARIAIKDIAQAQQSEYETGGYVFTGSSAGACETDVLVCTVEGDIQAC